MAFIIIIHNQSHKILYFTNIPVSRVQPAHPKKQLFSAPVNKFTAKWCAPSPNLARIRSCLDEYRQREAPARPAAKEKAASMEDLTPTKRIRIARFVRMIDVYNFICT